MTLNILKTLTTKTTTATSVKLIASPANRLGLGFEAGAYHADTLSPNPVTEQVRSRQEQSAPRMRKQMRAGCPDAVPPAGPVGCLPPGPRAVVSWSFTSSANWSPTATDNSRNRFTPVSVVRNRNRRDCQSPARNCDKQSLRRDATPATTAGK